MLINIKRICFYLYLGESELNVFLFTWPEESTKVDELGDVFGLFALFTASKCSLSLDIVNLLNHIGILYTSLQV